MCLGGGGSDYQYQEPVKYNPPPGPDMGPDRVNDKVISDTGNYNRDALKSESPAPRGRTAGGQAGKNPGLY